MKYYFCFAFAFAQCELPLNVLDPWGFWMSPVCSMYFSLSIFSLPGSEGCDSHLCDSFFVQYPPLLWIRGVLKRQYSDILHWQNAACNERGLQIPVQPHLVRTVSVLYTSTAPHLPERSPRLGVTTRQETVGDVTVPAAERTKPNGDSTQYRSRLLRLWNAISSREHDRLNGPVLFRKVIVYYLHGGGELAGCTQLRV